MHDIDRTQLEMGWEADLHGTGEDEYGDYEFEMEAYDEMYEYGDYEYVPELYGETYDEAYDEVYDEMGFEDALDEADEMELAAELLEVMDEDELDQFLGKMFNTIKRKARKVVPKSVRRALGSC